MSRPTQTFALEGWETVARRLRAVGDDFSPKKARRAAIGAMYRAGQLYTQAIQQSAPRAADDAAIFRRKKWPTDPVHMADSFKPRVIKAEAGEDFAVLVSTTRAYFWALFVEFGTKFMAARPFARTAVAATLQPMLARFVEGFSQRFEAAVARAKRLQ